MGIQEASHSTIAALKIIIIAAIAGVVAGTVYVPNSNTPEMVLIMAVVAAAYKYAEKSGWLAAIPHPTLE